MAVIGPDTAPLGERAHIAPVTQAQIAATVAAFVGKDYRHASPGCGSGHRGRFGCALSAASVSERQRFCRAWREWTGCIDPEPRSSTHHGKQRSNHECRRPRAMAGQVGDDRNRNETTDVAPVFENTACRHGIGSGDKHGRRPVRPFGELNDAIAQGERRYGAIGTAQMDRDQQGARQRSAALAMARDEIPPTIAKARTHVARKLTSDTGARCRCKRWPGCQPTALEYAEVALLHEVEEAPVGDQVEHVVHADVESVREQD